MVIKFNFFNILLLCLILCSNSASAQTLCKCNKPEIKTAFSNSTLILIGRVIRVTPSVYKNGYNEINVQIQAGAVFKGSEEVQQTNIIIYTKENPDECGEQLFPGMDYLIYATGLPAFYTTTSCSRNTLLDSANDEIIGLKELIKNQISE